MSLSVNFHFQNILVYGSLAYDRVMDFPGRFRDNLLRDKLRVLSVSFAVPQVRESFGGTAGNISYNLALLGEHPILFGSIGNDFSAYELWLKKWGIGTAKLTRLYRLATASAYIMTDKDDNQVTAFSLGAMARRSKLPESALLRKSLTIIAPGNPQDMVSLARTCSRLEAPYLWDPGQQIPQLSPSQLLFCLRHALAFIGNDYEISLMARKIGVSEKRLLASSALAVRTLGPKGSEIWQNGKMVHIPVVAVKNIDPTGAGDAYRAGLILGLKDGWPIATIGRLASVVASYAVASWGTQTHHFTWREVRLRYRRYFGHTLP